MTNVNEKSYRPITLADYKGQEKTKKLIKVYLAAAQRRGECLDHVLISGPSGCGKSTLAGVLANEMGGKLLASNGMTLKKNEDIYNIFDQIEEGTILFIDEIQALPKKLQEVFYTAMEDFFYDYMEEGEFSTRKFLPHFTLVAATNEVGGLSEAMSNRFPIKIILNPYSVSEMANIVMQSCGKLGMDISIEAAELVGKASRGVPRVANGIVRRVSDFAVLFNDNFIDIDVVNEAFDLMEINSEGFNRNDMNYLKCLANSRKPMGIDSIAISINLDRKTVENAIEPYLLANGYVYRTPRGRCLTEKGVKSVKEFV